MKIAVESDISWKEQKTTYPTGVCQSNGSLENELKETVCLKEKCLNSRNSHWDWSDYIHHWIIGLEWIIAQIIDEIVDEAAY